LADSQGKALLQLKQNQPAGPGGFKANTGVSQCRCAGGAIGAFIVVAEKQHVKSKFSKLVIQRQALIRGEPPSTAMRNADSHNKLVD